jgi:autotransporter-associated beta strand protein
MSSMVISNAALTVNAGAGSTLTVTNLSLSNNAVLNLGYNFSGGNPSVPALAVTNLALQGTTTINIIGPGAATTQFPLISYAGAALPNLNNFVLSELPPGATAHLVNDTANQSIDLAVTGETPSTWITLSTSDAFGSSSFNTAGNWANSSVPIAMDGYDTGPYTLRSPADTNAYTFGGLTLSVEPSGRFLMKGVGNQSLTVNNLILDGGVMDFANLNSDNFVETLGGSITLQPFVTSFMGALGGGNTWETLIITAPIGGGGGLQIGGSAVNLGQDVGTVVLDATNTYSGATTVASGMLLVNGSTAGSQITVATNSALGGTGTINGQVTVQAGGQLAPGIPSRGAFAAAIGTLTVSNTVTLSGTAVMKINPTGTPSSDRLVASSLVVNPGASLIVNNIGSTNLTGGDTFALFSTPVSGFATISLPALPGTNVFWSNQLATNGTIAVLYTINPNPTNITASVSGGNLALSWPADHTGWTMQVQTNAPHTGLGTNWIDVPNSSLTNALSVPINTGYGSVFYRLRF